MTSQSGGASVIPGVTSNGQTPGGEIIAGTITVGNAAAAASTPFSSFNGSVGITETPANQLDVDDVLDINQDQPLSGDSRVFALWVGRAGALNGNDYLTAAFAVQDDTASTAPVLQILKQGVPILELTTRKSITGALASVTDANAKAVLTSIIAALTGIKVATNNTT